MGRPGSWRDRAAGLNNTERARKDSVQEPAGGRRRAGCLVAAVVLICWAASVAAALRFGPGLLDDGPGGRATAFPATLTSEGAASLATPGRDPAGTGPATGKSAPSDLSPEATALSALSQADYPPRDYFESAARLSGLPAGARIAPVPPPIIGAVRTFLTDDGPVLAELLAMTEHAYFWAEISLGLSAAAVELAAGQFEAEYYSEITDLFGTEWQPGMDGDVRFGILHLDGFEDDSELGFFESRDEYPRSVAPDSNEQELLYLNMHMLELGSELYFGTLVHELQHLVHWRLDTNESAWVNEGLSQWAESYAGLNTVDTVADYLASPDTALERWEYGDRPAKYAHYGASYLFMVYLSEQLGQAAVADLARLPADGLAGVQGVLDRYRPGASLGSFIGDWVAANALDSLAAGDPYGYRTLDVGPPALLGPVEVPSETSALVNQFGTDYYALQLSGKATVQFQGEALAGLVPRPPTEGQMIWLAPGRDQTDYRLTGSVDLRHLESATLTFWAWYDLEDGYDFAYVTISTDNGRSWQLLSPLRARAGEFGPALTGASAAAEGNALGWVFERVVLDAYAGQRALLRFEVLTDGSVAGRGFAVDDIAIVQAGYLRDAEEPAAEWLGEGFVRTTWQVPQSWSVQLIRGDGDPWVQQLDLDDENAGQWTVDLGADHSVIAVTALTPFAAGPGGYTLTVRP
jgi:hypothetical protein